MKSLTCIIRRFSTTGSVVPYWYKRPSQAADDGSNQFKIKSEWGGDASEKEALEKRQEARKNSLDPMNGILKIIKDEPPSSLGKSVIIKVEKGTFIPSFSTDSSRNSDVNKSKETLLTDEMGNIREIKKEKKSKKSSRRSEDSGNDSRPSKHQKHNSSSSSSSSSSSKRDETTQYHHNSTHTAHIIPYTSTSNTSATMALRLKRIEREYAERKRAAIVLAKVDIYGPLNVLQVGNLPDERAHRYNQQFHPNIAR